MCVLHDNSVCIPLSATAGPVDCEQVLQLRFCELVFHSCSVCVCVCVYAHVPACAGPVWVFVCAYGHRCKHVCTASGESDNVPLCAEKLDSQGHSSSASSCFISAPPITLMSGDMWKSNSLTNHRQLHLFTSDPVEEKIKKMVLLKQ